MCLSLKHFRFGPTLQKIEKEKKSSLFSSIYDFCVHSSKIKNNVANNILKLQCCDNTHVYRYFTTIKA